MSGASSGRTAVITGASSGVGRAAAIQLAEEGWNVIGLGRDPQRAGEAEAAIRAAARPDARIGMILGDLASLADTGRMADAILARTDAIHLLANNAGGVRTTPKITPEGHEATFAGNHLGHFLLTRRLLPTLRATAAQEGPGVVRVVSVSSEGHKTIDAIDWDDLQGVRDWASGRNYSAAKLFNILFTIALAKRVERDGIVAAAMHPGEPDTNFAAHAQPAMKAYIATLDLIPVERSARTLTWLASTPDAAALAGGYFFDQRPVDTSPLARDAAAAERLWWESERLLAAAGC